MPSTKIATCPRAQGETRRFVQHLLLLRLGVRYEFDTWMNDRGMNRLMNRMHPHIFHVLSFQLLESWFNIWQTFL